MSTWRSFLISLLIVLPLLFLAGHLVPRDVGNSPTSTPSIPDVSSSTPVTGLHNQSLDTSSSSTQTHVSEAPVSLQSTSTPPVQKKNVPLPTAAVSPAPSLLSAADLQSLVNAGLSVASESLRKALVNILCLAPLMGGLHSISGSGVVIDPKGIVLTNAHIAQYFLLSDKGVSCTLRVGDPAQDAYAASLLYLPPAWVAANARLIDTPNPTGTGEHDYALLGIRGSRTTSPLPDSFAFVPLSRTTVRSGAPVVIGAYAAQFLSYEQIRSDLFPTLVYGSVKNLYTFGTTTVDVLALGGSAAAQEGSSGGGVVSATGELVGTIVTSTMEGDTSTRSLNAITAPYIRSDYVRETGSPLSDLLEAPLSDSIRAFSSTAATLEEALVSHLPH